MAMPDPRLAMQAMEGGAQPGTPPSVPMEGSPSFSNGMAALNQMNPGGDSAETTALTKVDEALELAHKLVMNCLPIVNQWDPKLAKDLHTVGRQLVDTRINLHKETPPELPPAMLSGGMQVPGGA